MSALQPVLSGARCSGERALLRPLCAADAERAFPLVHGRTEVLRWLRWRGPASLAELRQTYAIWRAGDARRGSDYSFAVEERATGAFAGVLLLRFANHPFTADLGYWLALEAQGRGLGSEAVELATALAFEALGAVLVYADALSDNAPSLRVLAKAGFGVDCATPIVRDGVPRSEVHLSITRAHWLRRARPAGRLEFALDG